MGWGFVAIIVTVLTSVTIVTCFALSLGHNGNLLMGFYALTGTIMGYVIKHYEAKFKFKRELKLVGSSE